MLGPSALLDDMSAIVSAVKVDLEFGMLPKPSTCVPCRIFSWMFYSSPKTLLWVLFRVLD